MDIENTVYDDTEFSFESEFEDDEVRMVPSYRDEPNSQNFTEGLMEAFGYDYIRNSDQADGTEMERDDIEAVVSEYGEVIFSRDQEGILEAIDEFREL
jgi:hypothetical protein